MSSGTFVDRIDPFAKRSLKKKQKKSQGSSRYRTGGDVELTALPLLKGKTLPASLLCLARPSLLVQFVRMSNISVSVINNSISVVEALGIRQILEPELISECLQIISESRLWRVSVVQQPVGPTSQNELENNSSRAFFLSLLSPQCKSMITARTL